MVPPLPISRHEFAQLFKKCVPPVGWMKNIGVANSGGPDSTCLLFLLRRFLSDMTQVTSQENPRNVVSLTVNHDLQTTSVAMAEHCSMFAHSLGVQHMTTKIPWSQPPFPPRPIDGQPFEAIARSARFQALFNAMTEKDVQTIAFGHHADDQVETCLIRLSWGSSVLGAGGMKPCRRWGMGMDKGSEWSEYGVEGMNRWIVRPLLSVSKDRILATCEANNLEYVTDATNFQPSTTIRNAIRYELTQGDLKKTIHYAHYPPQIVERLIMLEKTLQNVAMSFDSSPEELRRAVGILALNVHDVEAKVDSVLHRCAVFTVPGTVFLSTSAIQQIHDPVVQRALVIRVSRYASCYPWGSFRADIGRRKDSITRIVDQLWKPLRATSILRPFTAGGGVLWTPVFIKDGQIKSKRKNGGRIFATVLQNDMSVGWLVSRQPPLHRLTLKERGLPNTLEVDITETIIHALQLWREGGKSTVPILYDCRFLVQFNLERMPDKLASRLSSSQITEKLMLYPVTRWFLPRIVLEDETTSKILHDEIYQKATFSHPELEPVHLDRVDQRNPIDSGWIHIEWIRPPTVL